MSTAESREHKFELRLALDQAYVLRDALELYFRIGIGQFTEVVKSHNYPHFRDRCDFHAEVEAAEKDLNSAGRLLTGLPWGSYYSINSAEVSVGTKHACSMYDVVRKALWEERKRTDPEVRKMGYHTHNNDPINYVPAVPLAVMERIDDQERKPK